MDYNYRTLKLSIAQTVMKINLWYDNHRLTVHLSPNSTVVYHVAGLVPLTEGTTSRARLPQWLKAWFYNTGKSISLTPCVGLMRLDQQTVSLGNSCWPTASKCWRRALERLNSEWKLSTLPAGVWEEPEVWFGNWFSRGQELSGPSREVQGLRLQASNTGSEGLIPGRWTKIWHITQHGQRKRGQEF